MQLDRVEYWIENIASMNETNFSYYLFLLCLFGLIKLEDPGGTQ